ncbi:deaminase [Mycobacterium sp. 852002-51163_SCH5372311]|uniref:dihydrofolate reductase family protein n=1 Tax=Mycobacterium sp. 852002-51163_SCH5372311 TaxID=1834097 RepID=UPI0007FFE876|nr:dihydrofolate reductase family protein [Mycobacterium sp. 852002-51163_SCH5372311]OBF86137.1 deaminase [Mycobacterium sp. 852002-51163_SCH5372311]
MPTIYFTASSLDGYIVDDRGSMDWLVSCELEPAGPFGYAAFSRSVGAVVMGAKTYEWMANQQSGGWPYSQPTWVLTHRPQIVASGHRVHTFSGDVAELHPQLMAVAGYQDIWVVGGGDAAAQFVDAGLVDELIVTYAPRTLGSGGRLLPTTSAWKLIESGVNRDFLCARWRRA